MYDIIVTAANSIGCSVTDTFLEHVIIDPFIVSFVGSNRIGCTPRDVIFNNTTPVTTYSYWDFGDGTTGTGDTVYHTYTTPGFYNVTLITSNDSGCVDTLTQYNFVQVGELPMANLSFDKDTVCPNEPVAFTDSSAAATSWWWTFGDGEISTQQNPIHDYAEPGCYDLYMIANHYGCTSDTLIPDAICVLETKAEYVISPTVGCDTPHTVVFTDTSSGPVHLHEWDFGDGTDTVCLCPVVSHTYYSFGSYVTQLTVHNDTTGCVDSTNVMVTVLQVSANFDDADDSTVCLGHVEEFTNTSIGTTNYTWSFGDLTTTDTLHPSHTYPAAGVYDVTLAAWNSGGCSDVITKPGYITISDPVAGFVADTTQGCSSLTVSFADTSDPSFATITDWEWDFGDSTYSTDQHPVHVI